MDNGESFIVGDHPEPEKSIEIEQLNRRIEEMDNGEPSVDHSETEKSVDHSETEKSVDHPEAETSIEKEQLNRRIEEENSLSDEEREQRRDRAKILKENGNGEFAEGRLNEAVAMYSEALNLCPLIFTSDRSTYFSNRAAAYIRLEKWECAVADCSSALELGAGNNKPLQRRAYCYEKNESDLEKALSDYKNLLQLEPKNKSALEAIPRISRLIEERNEKMKHEMMGKLKDLGNLVLRPFGLSTDSFQMDPQPGGGYSISMKK